MGGAEFVIRTGGGIRNYPAGHPKKDELQDGQKLIAGLQYAQIWKSGTISKATSVRLDGQPSAGNHGANLQIQINGVSRSSSGGTTLAGVLVDGNLRDFSRTDQEGDRKKIVEKVKEALKKSLAGKINCATGLK